MARLSLSFLISLLLLTLGVGAALADPVWPDNDAGWTALLDPCGGPGPYIDPHDDFPGASGHHGRSYN